MDVSKTISILPLGDASGRQSKHQHRDGNNESTSDENRDQAWNKNHAVTLTGLASQNLTPDVRKVIEAVVAQIESIRMEAEQAKVREARYRELAMQHSFLAIPNRRDFERELQHVIDLLGDAVLSAMLVIVNLSNAAELRQRLGCQAVDAAMVHLVELIDNDLNTTDIQGSLCGYDLGIILFNGDSETAAFKMRSIREHVKNKPLQWRGATHPLELKTGATILSAVGEASDAIQAADQNLISSAVL